MSGTVLLIESDHDKRKRVHAELQARGHTVLDCTLSTMTHDLTVTTRPDVVLVDAEMHDVRPDRLLSEMSADERTANVPLIIANTTRMTDLIIQVEVNMELQKLRSGYHPDDNNIIDTLTGLYNARQMRIELAHFCAAARRYHQPLSLVLIGLDRLENTNRNHGRQAGDEVLCDIGQRLVGDVRDSDIAGRWSADQFMLILPGTPKEGAGFMAERFRETLSESQHILSSGMSVPITASFGCTDVNGNGVAGALESAETALRRAKRSGRNLVCLG